MVEYLAAHGVPALFALTKVDKLRNTERARRIERITERLGVDREQVVPFSSQTGEGRDELLESLEALLAGEQA
jgi:GTP-binding protein